MLVYFIAGCTMFDYVCDKHFILFRYIRSPIHISISQEGWRGGGSATGSYCGHCVLLKTYIKHLNILTF